MRRVIGICLSVLLLLAGVASADQDVFVSKKSKGRNLNPRTAVNPNNGYVLVVWVQDTAEGSEVWSALLRRKPSGKYKKPKAAKLSTGGRNLNIRAAWIEQNNQFFAVWDDISFVPGAAPSQILGRAINGKTGKPDGGVKVLVSDSNSNYRPVIAATSANGVQDIRVFYIKAAATGSLRDAQNTKAEIVSSALSTEYEALESTTHGTVDLEGSSAFVSIPHVEVVTDPEGGGPGGVMDCSVMVVNEFNDSGATAVVYLVNNGETVAKKELKNRAVINLFARRRSSDPASFSFALVTRNTKNNKLEGAFGGIEDWREINVSRFQKVRPSDTYLFLSLFAPLRLDIPSVRRRKAGSPAGYVASAQTDGMVYQQAFDEDWDLLEDKVALFSHKDQVRSLATEAIPSTGKKTNSVVVWSKRVGSKQEIRAHLFYVKPIEE